jgi:hypothetical protein
VICLRHSPGFLPIGTAANSMIKTGAVRQVFKIIAYLQALFTFSSNLAGALSLHLLSYY